MLRALDSGSDEPVNVRFGEASRDLLTDFLTHLNTQNKEKLHTLPACCGSFKDRRLMECILLMTKELRLDPLVGYHAIEMLQRFMLKHLAGLLAPPTPEGRSDGPLVPQLQQKFPLLVFSCLQLSSKLLLHSHRINNETAVHFLHSVGCEVSRQAVLEAELLVCRELHFALHAPDPLTFVETLLEVLGEKPDASLPDATDGDKQQLLRLSVCRTQRAVRPLGGAAPAESACSAVCHPTEEQHLPGAAGRDHLLCQALRPAQQVPDGDRRLHAVGGGRGRHRLLRAVGHRVEADRGRAEQHHRNLQEERL
ncbi:cyclin N-terminal domain-containing protein 1 isoform X2 [Nelusetta ayraudi]|uniref:cyclin N-terminal domain-containing protein 1 isoform X2 n=1 Tax=Nelusetta ayraudi TaxID=303726 RepID=UPI003F72E7F9